MSDVSQKTIIELLANVTAVSGSERPDFAIVNPRDFWCLWRGPRWRYPLPELRSLARTRRKPFWQRRKVFNPTRTFTQEAWRV